MKAPKMLLVSNGETVQQIALKDWLRITGKNLDAKKTDPLEDMLGIAMDDDKWELQIADDVEAEERKRILTVQKGISKAWKDHLRLVLEAAKAADHQKQEAEQRGMKIIAAAKAGEKIANTLASDMVENLAKATKGKFTMDGVSLKLVKGAKPTEADFTQVLSALSNLKGAATEAAETAGFYMVDAITLANEAGFNGNELLQQVAKEFGVKLFTAQQAERVGESFPPKARIIGPDGKLYNMTVHQEIMYGSGAVKDKAKIVEVIEKLKKGKQVAEPTLNGKPEFKHYSKNEVRKMMDEAAGHVPKRKGKKGGAGGTPTANILYLSYDDDQQDVIQRSDDLSLKACASGKYTVIDLQTMTILDAKGNPKAHIEELPAEWFEEAPPAPKEKKVKAEKAPEPKDEPEPTDADLVPA